MTDMQCMLPSSKIMHKYQYILQMVLNLRKDRNFTLELMIYKSCTLGMSAPTNGLSGHMLASSHTLRSKMMMSGMAMRGMVTKVMMMRVMLMVIGVMVMRGMRPLRKHMRPLGRHMGWWKSPTIVQTMMHQ